MALSAPFGLADHKGRHLVGAVLSAGDRRTTARAWIKADNEQSRLYG